MHLCFSITAHGFGHGAISCAVINQVTENHKEIKITILSDLSSDYLTSHLLGDFDLVKCSHDFGMEMYSAIEVNAKSSAEKYETLFNQWDKVVEDEKQLLQSIKPDCLISNISPISLAAAQALNIPTASVAPFNWAQIYWAYCDKAQNALAIFNKMKAVYLRTDFIYKPLPSVPFEYCNKEIEIACIASQLPKHSSHVIDLLPDKTNKIGLIALGGLPMALDLNAWPRIDGWHWLVDQPSDTLRDDMSQVRDFDLPFTDLIANSDLVLTKPGYGTYCEIASIAQYKKVRAISLVRPDWPETPYLNKFLASKVPFLEIELNQLEGDKFSDVLSQLLSQPYPETTAFESGSEQLVSSLLNKL